VDQRTVLHAEHVALGARMVPFGGWDMPLHYGSQLDEHHAVRRGAGVFDVSHMRAVDVTGADARTLLRRLFANDVAKLRAPGKALYSCMLDPHGGVIDDLIVYHLRDDWFRVVLNAATTEKDLAWMRAAMGGSAVDLRPRGDLAMLAIQGPAARGLAQPLLPAALRDAATALTPFFAAAAGDWLVARTGYTGEDGIEVMLPGTEAVALWRALLGAGVRPCGLGARDTLRLEAGMNLYGQDMDETVSPLESGLAWTVAFDPPDRDFTGRGALEAQRARGGLRRLVGLVLLDRGVLRQHQKVFAGDREMGEITSGGFAPTLDRSIALARVQHDLGDRCAVEIRGKRLAAAVVEPPFVRNGQALIRV
jgi:aminomethyltransferase